MDSENSLLYSLPDNLIYHISWWRGKKVFVHSICIFSRHCDVCFKNWPLRWTCLAKCTVPENIKLLDFWKQNKYINKQINWHSARKHNISGLLEIIEIHKYTSQRQCAKSMKSVSTAFWYKLVLFSPFWNKWGLMFQHVNVMIWSSQHVEACLSF